MINKNLDIKINKIIKNIELKGQHGPRIQRILVILKKIKQIQFYSEIVNLTDENKNVYIQNILQQIKDENQLIKNKILELDRKLHCDISEEVVNNDLIEQMMILKNKLNDNDDVISVLLSGNLEKIKKTLIRKYTLDISVLLEKICNGLDKESYLLGILYSNPRNMDRLIEYANEYQLISKSRSSYKNPIQTLEVLYREFPNLISEGFFELAAYYEEIEDIFSLLKYRDNVIMSLNVREKESVNFKKALMGNLFLSPYNSSNMVDVDSLDSNFFDEQFNYLIKFESLIVAKTNRYIGNNVDDVIPSGIISKIIYLLNRLKVLEKYKENSNVAKKIKVIKELLYLYQKQCFDIIKNNYLYMYGLICGNDNIDFTDINDLDRCINNYNTKLERFRDLALKFNSEVYSAKRAIEINNKEKEIKLIAIVNEAYKVVSLIAEKNNMEVSRMDVRNLLLFITTKEFKDVSLDVYEVLVASSLIRYYTNLVEKDKKLDVNKKKKSKK